MKKKASRAWKRPLAGLLTLAMVVCLLSSAPLSASASEIVEEPEVEVTTEVSNPDKTDADIEEEGTEETNEDSTVEDSAPDTVTDPEEDTDSANSDAGTEESTTTENSEEDKSDVDLDNTNSDEDSEEDADIDPDQSGADTESDDDVTTTDEENVYNSTDETAPEITEDTEEDNVPVQDSAAFLNDMGSDDISTGTSPEDNVVVDKTATPLDEKDRTTVTLQIGAEQDKAFSDVVFVLDKSVSVNVRESAIAMLDELMSRVGENRIKVGVVVFNRAVYTNLELTELNQDNYETIKEALLSETSNGTNIYAGLMAGKAMLDQDDSVANGAKHLVLVTDGVTYLWGDGQAEDGSDVYSIYSESVANGEENLYASHETITWHHEVPAYYSEIADISNWYNKYGASVQADIAKYGHVYTDGQYKAVDNDVQSGQGQDTDWSTVPGFEGNTGYVPAEEQSATACATDAAVYMAVSAWKQISGQYHSYAYAEQDYAATYPWAPDWIENLSSVGGTSGAVPEDTTGMFDDVKSSILYTIESGSVTDIIGDSFDLDIYSFSLTVRGEELAQDESSDKYSVSFGNGKYGIRYYFDQNTGEEIIEWDINEPVEANSPVKLSYSLILSDKETQPGTYTVPTNKSATLEYLSTDGSNGEKEFPVPEVTYKVEEASIPTEPENPDSSVSVDKTATPLDEKDRTTVTLQIGADQDKAFSDVVFVLDKSVSVNVRESAIAMLDELMSRVGENRIKVGVVVFNRAVYTNLELTELNQDNYETIKEALLSETSNGTNIYAGLMAGKAMLDQDDSVANGAKHLVLVTDGVTYLWGDGQAEDGSDVYSIYSESVANGEENLYASHETITWHHEVPAYYSEIADISNWYNKYGASVQADIAKYGHVYTDGQYKAVDNDVQSGQGQDTDWSTVPGFEGNTGYVPAEEQSATACATDAAVYMAVSAWKQISGQYHSYAYAEQDYAATYPWAPDWVENLSSVGGTSGVVPADTTGMFDDVKSSILYTIESGSVTDIIGNNFDLTGVGDIEMSVGGEKQNTDVVGNTVNFGTKTGDEYPYSVTYYPNGVNGDTREQFVWEINVPVENAKPLELTYTLKLVNKSSAEGSYTVPTNEEATLTYESTDGGSGNEKFPQPTVTYTVSGSGTTTPSDPGSGSGSGSGAGSSSGSSSSPTQTTSAQTGDETNILLPVVTLIIAAAVLGTVGTVYYKKKRS